MSTNIQVVSDLFEPIELWVHYVYDEKKADVGLGLFMSEEALAAAYVEAEIDYKDELDKGLVEFIEEED